MSEEEKTINKENEKPCGMSKKQAIIFWIIFPLVSLLITALMVFYLDLARGPLAITIIEFINIAVAVVLTIIFRNKRVYFRLIPLSAFFIITAILLPLANPIIVKKHATGNFNATPTEVLELQNGKVRGVYNNDETVEVYAGIPYAKAPVGEYRWREPEDVTNWEGIKDCFYFAPMAVQSSRPAAISSLVDLYAEKSWHPNYLTTYVQDQSEDCLYLNIWKPHTNETNLPILIYYHGGSLTSGSSADDGFNGEMMAKKGIIMITVSYRLGILGYFAHQELRNESVNHTTGNYGLLDQIKALKWVNDNASYFGGDKSNITIAGESAGSSSVSAICSSPLASGLFKRAIGESSSVVVKRPPHTFRTMEKALKVGEDTFKEFNVTSIEELRKIPAKELINTSYNNDSMTIDGYALTKYPYEVYGAGENNEEALLNGFNVLEADAFVVPSFLLDPTNKDNIYSRLEPLFGISIAKKLMEALEDEIEADAFTAFNKIYSTYWFMHPHQSWTEEALKNGETVYRYQFTKNNGFIGTYHSGEIIYAYNNVKKERDKASYRYDDSDIALSDTMSSYWVNFVRTGDPNGTNLPIWNPYNLTDKKIMELGSNVGPIDDPYQKLYPIIDEFIESQILKEEI